MRLVCFFILTVFSTTNGISQAYYKKDTSYNTVKQDTVQNKAEEKKSGESSFEAGVMTGFSGTQSYNLTYLSWKKHFRVTENFELYASTGLTKSFGASNSTGEGSLSSNNGTGIMFEGGGRYQLNEKVTLYGSGFYQEQPANLYRNNNALPSSFTNNNYSFSMGMEYEVTEDVHFGIEVRHSNFQSPRSNPFFAPENSFRSPHRGFRNGSFMWR